MKNFRIKRIVAAALAATMIMSECAYASELDLLNGVSAAEDIAYEDVTVEADGYEDANADPGDIYTDDIAVGDEEEGVSDDAAEITVSGDTVSGDSLDDADTVSDNDADTVSGDVVIEEEPDIDFDHAKPLPEEMALKMFPGLSKGAVFDNETLADKKEVADHLKESALGIEGQDYVENQILVFADDEAQAEEYAAAYNGTLENYEFDLAVISLNTNPEYKEASVMDAMCASANPKNMLPAAWPNHYRYICEEGADESMTETPDDEDAYEDYDDQDEEGQEMYVDENGNPAYEDEDAADVEEADDPDPDFNEEEYEYTEPEDGEQAVFYDENGDIVEEGASSTMDAFGYTEPMLLPDNSMYQWHHNLIGSKYAWQAGYTGRYKNSDGTYTPVKVCVIDTGVIQHNDLKPMAGTYYTNGDSATDKNGHGTNVCGIIAARANGIGGRGVAPDAALYSIAAGTSKGSFSESAVYYAIKYAVDTWHVEIINMSFGGPAYNDVEAKAVKYAYDNGVAVFISAGNEYTNAAAYPASCKGAICIGAVDRSNNKSSFSNTRNVVFTGPGVEIYSTAYDNVNAYDEMSGTSQASPNVAGIAAVLLGSGKVSGTGKKRVENLKKLMQKGCIKSGLGKGTPNLAKCLKLKTSTKAPDMPRATSKSGTYKVASMNVKLSIPAGTVVYYTTNGSKPKYKNGIPTGISYGGGNIPIGGASKVTLKAIAVSNTNKKVSKVATFKYTLKPKVSGITVTPKNGINDVVKGGSLQMMASFSPANAANKKVKWSLADKYPGVTISQSGLIKVAKKTTVTSFAVYATATDGSNVKSSNYPVHVINEGQITSVKPASSKVTLSRGTTNATTVVKVAIKGKGALTTTYLHLISSNENVAVASIATDDSILITGKSPGKAKITLVADDGSGKTATIKVTVKQYVTGITISTTASGKVAQGKGFKATATIKTPVNTSASNKKVTWSLPDTAKAAGISINAKNGTVKVGSKTPTGTYTIYASSKDGNVKNAAGSFTVIAAAERVASISVDKKVSIFRVVNAYGSQKSKTISFAAKTAGGAAVSEESLISITYKSGLVSVTRLGNSITVTATGNATGTANITIASADGTNIKKTLKVSVVNPPSAVRLAPPAGRSEWIAKGKSLKLKTVVETDYGPISKESKKFSYSPVESSAIKVNSKGTVKAKSAYDKDVYVTATAKDGSGVTASYKVSTCTRIKRFTKVMSRKETDGLFCVYVLPQYQDSGWISGEFQVKTNKSGLGVKRKIHKDSDGNIWYGVGLCGNKRGKYKVTIAPNDGNKAKWSFMMTIY
ncbi:MAG: S8 family serine peptidase [Lachnospiraceae bacterium]|nr:S8 family serine peptidase [Lachnospiraceae bacterium]